MSWYWLIICTISGAVLGFLYQLYGEGFHLDGEAEKDSILSGVILGAIGGIYFYFFYYLLDQLVN